MIYCNIDYKDLSKTAIELFIYKLIENNQIPFNLMSVSGADMLAEENIEINKRKIQDTLNRENFNVVLRRDKFRFELNRIKKNRRKIGIGITEENSEISDFVFKNFPLTDLQYAKRDHDDYIGWDRTLDYDFWIYKKRPIPKNIEYFPVFDFNNPNKKELSIEHIPTHTHYMRFDDELIFEACWQMYFGKIYYKYIPKPLFDDFSDCFENIILDGEVRKITLYEKVDDFNNAQNMSKLWAFRRNLGIDSIAHELTRGTNRIEPKDLPVLITKQNCERGTTRVTRFLDVNDKLVPQSKAVKKEITEYDDNGINPILQLYYTL